jgi:Tfp pilus assembly protein FimT
VGTPEFPVPISTFGEKNRRVAPAYRTFDAKERFVMCIAPQPLKVRQRGQRRPVSAGRRGYSLIEMLLTILLIQIIGGLVAVQVSSATATERTNYASQETISALRYARQLALSTGQPAGVSFDNTNQTITVFKRVNNQNVTVTNAALMGGQYVINLKTRANVSGTTVSNINLAGGGKIVTYGLIGGTSAMPRGLGSTANNGTITLKSGASTITILVPDAGEPSVQ